MADIDLTMTLDPAAHWPDPQSCPDWPLARDERSRAMNAPKSAAEAAEELRRLGQMLNSGKPVRAPTEAERAELRERYFAPGSSVNWWMDRLGFAGIRPASPSVANKAEAMVRALHLRGYLRKLAERDAQAAASRAEAETARLQRLVDDAPDTLARMRAELAEAEEGEARHRQRMADERAAHRAAELRRAIPEVEAEADRARAMLTTPAAA